MHLQERQHFQKEYDDDRELRKNFAVDRVLGTGRAYCATGVGTEFIPINWQDWQRLAGVILCPRQRPKTFVSMPNAYFSHTQGAETYQGSAYEICSYQRSVHNTIALHGSLTATGVITFTLTENGQAHSAPVTYVVSTWTDSTPMYSLCGRHDESWTTFESQTIKSWLTSSLSTAGACITDPSSRKPRVGTTFWHELRNAILAITLSATTDFGRFVTHDTQRNENDTFQDGLNSGMNQRNWGDGSCP